MKKTKKEKKVSVSNVFRIIDGGCYLEIEPFKISIKISSGAIEEDEMNNLTYAETASFYVMKSELSAFLLALKKASK